MIGEEGRGIVVLIREPQATSLSSRVKAQLEGMPTPHAESGLWSGRADPVRPGCARNDTPVQPQEEIIGLDGYGLTVVGTRSINPAISGAD